ncbi:hypothetical protein Tco_1477300 [Tanacetum coccineum]
MGDENPIRTLGDYSKLIHEGYRNTIELLVGNNMLAIGLNVFQQDPSPHGPTPQPQALETTFKARVRDYMAAHTKRMERFENAILKQREEINDIITEMFELLKEQTTSKTPEKVLIMEEAKSLVTKNVNSISLARGEDERSDKMNETLGNTVKPTRTKTGIPVKEAEGSNETKNKPIEKAEKEEVVEAPSSRLVEYYLKHRINEKLIEGIFDNPRFNNSGARVRKVRGKTYNVSPRRACI